MNNVETYREELKKLYNTGLEDLSVLDVSFGTAYPDHNNHSKSLAV